MDIGHILGASLLGQKKEVAPAVSLGPFHFNDSLVNPGRAHQVSIGPKSERLISLGSEMGVFYGLSRAYGYIVVSSRVGRFCWLEGSCGEETVSAHSMTKSIS